MFQPAGDAVLCRCNHVIDMSHGKEVPVETEPTVTVSGLRYNVRGEGGGERGRGGRNRGNRFSCIVLVVVEQKRMRFIFGWCGIRGRLHAASRFRC